MYKRQVLGRIMDIKKQNKVVLKDYLKETQNIDIDAVSYTHLDVYKRQGCPNVLYGLDFCAVSA